ncbi:hypothetical protein IPdc08_00222 [archaeon]|nr:hypothetical protein IPdc08_00222 [archaeon]
MSDMNVQGGYSYREILDFYFDDIFNAILSFQKPLVSSYEFLRKKHMAYKYKKLIELKNLSESKKENLILDFLACLPERASVMAYSESYDRIIEVFSTHLGDAAELLEEINSVITPQEQEKIIKIQMQKNEGIITSVRKSLSEVILEAEDPEKVILIDQALALAEKLIEESLKEKDEPRKLVYFLHLLILLLRIEGINRELTDYEVLYEDIAIISGELKVRLSEFPEGALELIATG